MTRKDTILIAVVVNAGLLAMLFATAIIYDTDKDGGQKEFVYGKSLPEEQGASLIAAASTGDEVDNVLKYYSQPTSQPILVEPHSEIYVPEPLAVQTNAADDDDFLQDLGSGEQDQVVEVTVKKGDVLEKIARANGTTVAMIKRANGLQNEKLSIGQVLKIPLKREAGSSMVAETSIKKPDERRESVNGEAVYHVVRSGDNPWKIAKKYDVKYDEILRLNHLDEEKARNLKVGDRIRVK